MDRSLKILGIECAGYQALVDTARGAHETERDHGEPEVPVEDLSWFGEVPEAEDIDWFLRAGHLISDDSESQPMRP